MRVSYHKKFLKEFDRLPPKTKEKFYSRLKIFSQNPV